MRASRAFLRRLGLALATATASGALAVSTAFAAGSSEKLEWSIDLDCTQCHAAEAASLGILDGQDGAAEVDGAEGQEAAAGQLGAAAEAGGSASGETGGQAADDSSAGSGPDEMTGLEGYAAMHAQSLGLDCTTCHVDSDKLAKAHKRLNSGKEATRLKKTSVGSDVCLTCHDQESLAEATADCTILTDSEGTTVNPHDLPAVDEHTSVACVSCHEVHTSDESLAQTSKATCGSCHHAGVYECGTCH